MKIMIAILAVCLVPALSGAGENDSGPEKIDSITAMQKEVLRTVKNDPLTGKNIGVEINPVRLLLLGKISTFSGTVSLFNVDRNAEIALPFFFSASDIDREANGNIHLADVTSTIFTLDIHYRYFPGNTRNGFYLSGFARYAYLDGPAYGATVTNADGTREYPVDRRATDNRLGIGVGLGYRIFSYKGLYWGCGAGFGRYLTGESRVLGGNAESGITPGENELFIYDVELLKIGYAF